MSSGRKLDSGHILMIVIAGVILYFFGADILAWILEMIIGIGNAIKTLITDLLYILAFVGVIYLIIKVYELLRGK